MDPESDKPLLVVAAPPAFGTTPEPDWEEENEEAALMLTSEDYPKIDHLITEDGQTAKSYFVERQQRLLVDGVYSSWAGPGDGQPFLAANNVGVFNIVANPAIVPDFMLSKDVEAPKDVMRKEGRAYFLWLIGKPPDVVIEIVSDRRGGEMSHKMLKYAQMGVPFYVVFDPDEHLGGGVLRAFGLCHGQYEPLEATWLPNLGLGLTFWEGEYEGITARWLRWCDVDGNVLLTGRERAEQKRQRAEQATQELQQGRAEIERLKAQLRALGHEPPGA